MHIKLLTISAAVFLFSSSVTAMGNSQGVVQDLTTNSGLVQSALQMAHGDVGGLRRRKINDLANGPRYGFPATEKKATKRSILNTLLTSEVPQKTSPQGQHGGYGSEEEDEEDDDESGGRHEAKREMKARRRLLARADIEGIAIKTQMGTNGLLSSSQKLVSDNQLAANKMVGQTEHIVDGVLTSTLKSQSKKTSDAKSDTTPALAPATTDDKKTTTGGTSTAATDSIKKGDSDDNNTTKQSAPITESQISEDKLSPSSSSPSTGNTAATDNLKINPQYLGSTGSKPYDSSSNLNRNYFA